MLQKLGCFFILVLLLSCSPSHISHQNSKTIDEKADDLVDDGILDPAEKEYEHLRWVAKASLLLRGQKELSPDVDDFEQLKKMSKDEIVNLYLGQNDFYKTVADFSLYYIGFRQEGLFNEDLPSESLTSFSQVISTAQAISQDQSFFEIFHLQQPLYTLPFKDFSPDVFASTSLTPPAVGLTLAEQRDFFYDQALLIFQNSIPLTDQELAAEFPKLCHLNMEFQGFLFIGLPIYEHLGIPATLYASIKSQLLFPLFCDASAPLDAEQIPQFRELVKNYEPFLQTLKELSKDFSHEVYNPTSITEVKSLPAKHFAEQLSYQNVSIAGQIPNSSTNRNRRRAAYILKHFFCDDLTPVNIELPSEHADVHGQNPSCYACHYKLDPMAGFFKDYGFNFMDFSMSEKITFDDLKTVDKKEYQEAWKKPSSDQWNIGYIQSTQFENLNLYGENLEDLHKILQTSLEVKKCFVKKTLEYATDTSQVFDPGFIDDLTQKFIAQEKSSPREAFKNLFRQIALSKTFQKNNRDPQTCYDLKSGTKNKDRPPCEIASILEVNCVKCHNNASGVNGLDLTRWVTLHDKTMGFPHRKNGKQLSHVESFQLLTDRITTSDPKKRMPPGDMNPVARQTLYKWLQQK